MGPIDRAAKALAEVSFAQQRWEDLSLAAQENLKNGVMTVLTTLREPDDHMEAAGDLVLETASCRTVWAAMLDAALANREVP
ncbi:MAG: hypothetical protein J7530_06165 [Novosphingobium sp.]|nr:hypothetical protein [Novosphingobium sp.]